MAQTKCKAYEEIKKALADIGVKLEIDEHPFSLDENPVFVFEDGERVDVSEYCD